MRAEQRGYQLAELRKNTGLTQAQVAAVMGVSQARVSQIEHGKVTEGPRELGQVSIGYLAVADDPLGGDIGVRDIVGPEFMPRVSGGAVEDLSCRAGRLAFADEQPHQAALSDRARREVSALTCAARPESPPDQPGNSLTQRLMGIPGDRNRFVQAGRAGSARPTCMTRIVSGVTS
jgi:transcriptional regulator with XRE-family HTH domain